MPPVQLVRPMPRRFWKQLKNSDLSSRRFALPFFEVFVEEACARALIVTGSFVLNVLWMRGLRSRPDAPFFNEARK